MDIKSHERPVGQIALPANNNRGLREALVDALARTKCCTPMRPFPNQQVPK